MMKVFTAHRRKCNNLITIINSDDGYGKLLAKKLVTDWGKETIEITVRRLGSKSPGLMSVLTMTEVDSFLESLTICEVTELNIDPDFYDNWIIDNRDMFEVVQF